MYEELLVGRAKFLKDCVCLHLRRTCIYGSRKLNNSLREDSNGKNFIKNTSKLQFLRKKLTFLRKLWIIESDNQMLTGPDLDSESFILYFCKKKMQRDVWFTCNVRSSISGNCVLVLPLTFPPFSNSEQFGTFKKIAPSFCLYPSHTAPLSVRAQFLLTGCEQLSH